MAARLLRLRLDVLLGAFRSGARHTGGALLGVLVVVVATAALLAGLGTLEPGSWLADDAVVAGGAVVTLGFLVLPFLLGPKDPMDPRAFRLFGIPSGRLAAALGDTAEVVHLEDLYAGWTITGAVSRLRAGVLRPLAEGRPGSYHRYDWTAERFAAEPTTVPVRQVLVVEGCGSSPRSLDPWTTLRIWVEAPARLRIARGLARDGAGLQPQAGRRYGVSIQLWVSPLGVPCNQIPLGTISAVDLVSGKLLWQVPAGTSEDTGPLGVHQQEAALGAAPEAHHGRVRAGVVPAQEGGPLDRNHPPVDVGVSFEAVRRQSWRGCPGQDDAGVVHLDAFEFGKGQVLV